jgi:hypothetical protein
MMPDQNGPSRAGGATEAKGKIASRRFSGSAGREQVAARGAARRARSRDCRQGQPIDFVQVNRAALAVLPRLLLRWLPGARIEGAEYVVRNPKRPDRRAGSFKVNLATGRWADFATGDKGGDPVSLAAHLADCGQVEAARRLAAMLGTAADGR